MVKKKKRLTLKEKQLNREVKKELRECGIIPPVKKKLNRKKFINEVLKELKDFNIYLDDVYYLHKAVSWMQPLTHDKISLEVVGVFKLFKIAIEIKKYMKDKKDNGETHYNELDLYKEVVKPILDL